MPAAGAFVVALVALAGGLSLVPVGLYLMLFPGPTRWIGLLDAGMLVIGVALARADRVPQDEVRRV